MKIRLSKWCHNTHYYDNAHNNKKCDTQHNDTQHNDQKHYAMSFMPSVVFLYCYGECVSILLNICSLTN